MIRRVLSGLSGFGFRQADDDDRQVVPFEKDLVTDLVRRVETVEERARMMRHTGRPECPIPEHQDALQRMGHLSWELGEARALAKRRFELMIILEAKVADLTEQLARANSRLNHPARGNEAA